MQLQVAVVVGHKVSHGVRVPAKVLQAHGVGQQVSRALVVLLQGKGMLFLGLGGAGRLSAPLSLAQLPQRPPAQGLCGVSATRGGGGGCRKKGGRKRVGRGGNEQREREREIKREAERG